MNYLQLWRSSGLAASLLLTAIASPSALAASHTVRSGDTFSAIARKYQLSVSSLQKANPKVKPGVIVKGQMLNLPPSAKPVVPIAGPGVPVKKETSATVKVPASKVSRTIPMEPSAEADRLTAAKPVKQAPVKTITTYRVQPGDTLASLARRNGVSVADLVEMNGLETSELQGGQKLVLPGGSPAPARSHRDQENTVDLTPPARQPREETPSRRSAAPVNPPATQGTYYHVVKNGDTFSSIARECGVSVAALTKANRSVNPNRLSVNQRLNVPGVQVASRAMPDNVMDESPRSRPTAYQSQDPEENDSGAPPLQADPLPPAGSSRIAYRVTDRDSMDSIAQEFNTTAKELRQINQMGPFDRLTAGNFVTVPWQEAPHRN